MNLKASNYNKEDREQVMQLICNEYSYDLQNYSQFFKRFYEHDFQKNAMKVVVKDEGKESRVVGFFALFYWPYKYNGKTYRSYKGVNAIVDPAYRGNGIFKRILKFVDQEKEKIAADFFIATPLPAAFYGFKKDGWKNVVDLHWYLRPNNIFSFLFPFKEEKLAQILNEEKRHSLNNTPAFIHHSDDETFIRWRAHFYKTKKYYYTYKKGEHEIQFGMKLNIRKKFIRELIIGELTTNSYEKEFIQIGIKNLLSQLKRIGSITFVSIAFNPHNSNILDAIRSNNFFMIKNKIHIVVKDLSGNQEILNPEKWILYRGDLDSW